MSCKQYGYGYYINCIQAAMVRHMNNALKAFDLTKSQEEILRFLRFTDKEHVSQRDIEQFFHISNPTVTGILNRLEEKGYIRRICSPKDKRVRYIESTPKADELTKVIHDNVKIMEQKMSHGLSEEEKEELFVLLEKVKDNVIRKENVNV